MFMNMFISLNMVLNFLMMINKNPYLLTLIILMQTINICVFMSSMMINFWMSYILFLIFIGSMMILFVYITSLIPNKMMKFNLNYLLFFLVIILSSIFINKFYMMNNEDMNNFFYLMNFKMNYIFCIKLYNNYSSKLTLMLILYLLIVLIMSTYINKSKMGPLRKLN